MKAVVCAKYGPPSLLKLMDVDKPTPKANELLVKVYATTVNRTDCGVLRAHPFIARLFYGLRKPRNPILGNEFAGEVEAVGQDVTTFQVRDKVVGANSTTFGAHAQYVVIPAHWMVTSLPGNLKYEEAAPTGEGAGYALKDLRAGKVTRGQRILIQWRHRRHWFIVGSAREALWCGSYRGVRHQEYRPGEVARGRSRHRLHQGRLHQTRPDL